MHLKFVIGNSEWKRPLVKWLLYGGAILRRISTEHKLQYEME
jgi:hypothetical protein